MQTKERNDNPTLQSTIKVTREWKISRIFVVCKQKEIRMFDASTLLLW